MDGTTTAAPPDTGAGAPAQPADGAQATAVQTQQTQSQSQPAQADDTAAWLQSKGVDPTDPEAFQKVAAMAYNSEKQMTKATMEASELRKSLTQPSQPTQPTNGGESDTAWVKEFAQDYRRDKLISGFKESHPDWHDHEPAMVKVLNEVTPSGYTNSQLVNAGIMSLETVYALAKASTPAPDNSTQLKAEAQHEVLQTLANTQRAGGGTPQASNSTPQAPVDDPFMRGIKMSRGQ